MTRWLNDSAQEAWRAFVTLTMVELPKLEATFREHDPRRVEYGLLVALNEAPDGSLRMSAPADVANVSQSRLSHRMHRLVQRGQIELRACTEDGRGTASSNRRVSGRCTAN